MFWGSGEGVSRVDGVSSARIDLAKKTAYVEYDSAKTELESLKKAILGAEYKMT